MELNQIWEWQNNINNEIKGQSDRSLAIVCASVLDSLLETLLKVFLIEDNDIDKKLFESQMPLSTFSSKISISYYCGLISKHERTMLDTIRKIRNEFAHNCYSVDFSTQRINSLCYNLSVPDKMYIPDVIPIISSEPGFPKICMEPFIENTAKERFVITFKYLANYLMRRQIDDKLLCSKCKEYHALPAVELEKTILNNLENKKREYISLAKQRIDMLKEAIANIENGTVEDYNKRKRQKQLDDYKTELRDLENEIAEMHDNKRQDSLYNIIRYCISVMEHSYT